MERRRFLGRTALHQGGILSYKSNENGKRRGLFEFVVPMFPKNHLRADTISSYKNAFSHGVLPTALAVSILDVKQPANWNGNPELTKHWCLSHYLLDGHHKVYAAAEQGTPVSILSFEAELRVALEALEHFQQAISTARATLGGLGS